MYVFKHEQKNRKIIAHLGHSSIPKHIHQVSGCSFFELEHFFFALFINHLFPLVHRYGEWFIFIPSYSP